MTYSTPELLTVGAAQNLVLDGCTEPVTSRYHIGFVSCEPDNQPNQTFEDLYLG